MKDKRQRMALAWPYAMYTDPAFAASLLQAAAASTGYAPYSYYHALRYAPYPLRPQPASPAAMPGGAPLLPGATGAPFLRPTSLTPPGEAPFCTHNDPATCRCPLFPSAAPNNNTLPPFPALKIPVMSADMRSSPSPNSPLGSPRSPLSTMSEVPPTRTQHQLFQPYKSDISEKA